MVLLRYIRVWKQFDENLKVIAGSCIQLAINLEKKFNSNIKLDLAILA